MATSGLKRRREEGERGCKNEIRNVPSQGEGVVDQLGSIRRAERGRFRVQHADQRVPRGRVVVDAVVAALVGVGLDPRHVGRHFETH